MVVFANDERIAGKDRYGGRAERRLSPACVPCCMTALWR